MDKESRSEASRKGMLFLQTARMMRDVFKAAEEDGNSFSAWFPPCLVIASLTDQPVILHISFYRCFPLNKLTAMYPANLRRLNASGTSEPYSIVLCNPEAIFRYAMQVRVEALINPRDFQKLITVGMARANEGYAKI